MNQITTLPMCMGAVLAIGENAQQNYDSSGKGNLYGRYGKPLITNPSMTFPRLLSNTYTYIDLLKQGRGKSKYAAKHEGGRGIGIRLENMIQDLLVSDAMLENPDIPQLLSPAEQTDVFLGHAIMCHEIYSSTNEDDTNETNEADKANENKE